MDEGYNYSSIAGGNASFLPHTVPAQL